MAQSDGGGELQVASRCWDVALTDDRVSREERSKSDSVHFFLSLRRQTSTVFDPAVIMTKNGHRRVHISSLFKGTVFFQAAMRSG